MVRIRTGMLAVLIGAAVAAGGAPVAAGPPWPYPPPPAAATDARNAFLEPVVVDLGALTHDVFRVRHTIDWYHPDDPSRRIGRAVHWAEGYEVQGTTLGASDDWCYRTRLHLPDPTEPPPGHTGTYGAHQVIDSPEYPGLTCVYATTPPYALLRMRANVAVAFNSGPAPATLKRRLLVQSSDDTGPDPSWTTVRTTAPIGRSATDARNAVFPAVRFAISNGPDHARWRIVQRLIWPSPAGRADEVARYSLQDDGDPAIGGPVCGGQD